MLAESPKTVSLSSINGRVESHTGQLGVFRVLNVGGNAWSDWGNSVQYGLSNSNVNNALSNSNANIGARLSFIIELIRVISTSPNGGTSESKITRLVAFNAKTWQNNKGSVTMRNRLKDCYAELSTMSLLKKAADEACTSRSDKIEVARFRENEDELLGKLQEEIKTHSIRLSDYRVYYKNERGKRRLVADIALYPDRILQCAIAIIIEDKLNRTLIYQTHASIKGHGTHLAMTDARKHLYNDPKLSYCLIMDIDQFFAKIPPMRIKLMMREYIKDNELLFLIDRIIDNYTRTGYGGIALGGRLSALFANLYLSELDHYLKEVLHVHVMERYMDNYFIFGYSVAWLESIRVEVVVKLAELGLELNEGASIQKIDSEHGIDMVGWIVYSDHVLIRKKTKERMRRTFARIQRKLDRCEDLDESDLSAIGSYTGSLKWFDSYNLSKKIVKPVLTRIAE